MKVNEIISEDRQQLNELAPILAGIGIGGVITAISIGISAWSAYEIIEFIKKYNEDPDAVTDEQWGDVFIDAALLFTPGLAKLGRKAFVKIVPRSWVSNGGQWIKGKFRDKVRGQVKKDIKSRLTDPKTGKPLTGKARADAIKDIVKGRKDLYSKAAEEVVKTGLDTGMKALGLLAVVHDYKASCAYAKEQYDLYSKDREKSAYKADASEQEAYKSYEGDCDLALGAFVTAVGLIVTPTPVAKLLSALTGKWGKFLATVIGGLGGAVAGGTGGAAAGAAAGLGGTILAKKMLVPFFQGKVVDTATKGAIIAFLGTDAGKEFLKLGIVRPFLEPVGALSRTIVNGLADALEKFVGPNAASNAARNAVNPEKPRAGQAAQPSQNTDLNQGNVPWNLRVTKEGNKVFIGGRPVTDDNGKLLSGLGDFIKKIKILVKGTSYKDPFDVAGVAIPPGYNMSAGPFG